MNQNEQQNRIIQEQQKEIRTLYEKRARMCVKMEGVEKAIKRCGDMVEKFSGKLTDVVNSFNQDKQHAKTFMENNYVSKKEFKFYKYLENKAAVIGFIVIAGALTVLGTIGIYVIKFVEKIIKL